MSSLAATQRGIFYGAGQWARINLNTWIERGILPLCFADADESKQGTLFPPQDVRYSGKQFKVLSLREALENYPESNVFICVSLSNAEEVREYLQCNGVPETRLFIPPALSAEDIPEGNNLEVVAIHKKLKDSMFVREIVINKDGWMYKIELFNKRIYIVNSLDCNTTARYLSTDEFDEKEELQIFMGLVKENAVVFDVGANNGIYSTVCGTTYEDITVHAFEPVPQIYKMLCATINKNGLDNKIYCNNMGLSNTNGAFKFYWNQKYPGASSLGYCALFGFDEVQEILVEVITLDEYVAQNHISKIDYIKIDVEGAEKLVIEGALKSIRQFRPVIQLEQEPAWTQRFDYYPDQLVQLLRAENYRCYVIKNKALFEMTEYTPTPRYTNFYFIPKESNIQIKD